MESHYIKHTYPQINATHKKVTLKLTLLFNINPDNIQYNNSEKKEETILLQQSHTPSLKNTQELVKAYVIKFLKDQEDIPTVKQIGKTCRFLLNFTSSQSHSNVNCSKVLLLSSFISTLLSGCCHSFRLSGRVLLFYLFYQMQSSEGRGNDLNKLRNYYKGVYKRDS